MDDKKKFEETLQELEGIVRQLEGNLPLDDAIKAFERGIELSKQCVSALKEEKGKLSLLVDDINNITQEFTLD